MVEQSTEDYGLTSEDINAAFAAFPEAAQAAQISLLRRALAARDEKIVGLEEKIKGLESQEK
tara:strand:+ start:1160 stop:1345 length:186 start_codon:yes stop_codon:yes gene_type:complete